MSSIFRSSAGKPVNRDRSSSGNIMPFKKTGKGGFSRAVVTENSHQSCLLRSKGSDCRIFFLFFCSVSDRHIRRTRRQALLCRSKTSSFVQIVVAPQEAPFRWPKPEDRSRRRLFFRRNPFGKSPRGISAHRPKNPLVVEFSIIKLLSLFMSFLQDEKIVKAFPQAATLPSRTSPVGGRVENYAVIYISSADFPVYEFYAVVHKPPNRPVGQA